MKLWRIPTGNQLDTAQALARGVRYYRFTDPPFLRGGVLGSPCPADAKCVPITTARGSVQARCNKNGVCQETAPPHNGAHYFYSVTATDHKLEEGPNNTMVAMGPGLAGDPSSNFIYMNPPTSALVPERYREAESEIYVVPNPATVETMLAVEAEAEQRRPDGHQDRVPPPAALGGQGDDLHAVGGHGGRAAVRRYDGATVRWPGVWSAATARTSPAACTCTRWKRTTRDSRPGAVHR